MKIIISFFFLFLSSQLNAQIDSTYYAYSKFHKYLNPILEDKEKVVGFNDIFNRYYESEDFQEIYDLSTEKDIEILSKDDNFIIRQIWVNVKNRKAIESFDFDFLIDSLGQKVEEIALKSYLYYYSLDDLSFSTYFTHVELEALKMLPVNEKIRLLEHPSLVIRAIMVFHLSRAGLFENVLLPYLAKNGMNRERITCMNYCVVSVGRFLGDYLFDQSNYLDSSQRDILKPKIDSVLIFNDNILKNATYVFSKMVPTDLHRDRLTELVVKKKYLPAVIPFLKLNPSEKYLSVIMEIIEQEIYQDIESRIFYNNPVLILKYLYKTEPDFLFPFLEKYSSYLSKEILNQRFSSGNRDNLFRNIVLLISKYDNSESKIIVENLKKNHKKL